MHIAHNRSVLKLKDDLPFLTSDEKESEKEEHVHFCSSDCLFQFTVSRQNTSADTSKVCLHHDHLSSLHGALSMRIIKLVYNNYLLTNLGVG